MREFREGDIFQSLISPEFYVTVFEVSKERITYGWFNGRHNMESRILNDEYKNKDFPSVFDDPKRFDFSVNYRQDDLEPSPVEESNLWVL